MFGMEKPPTTEKPKKPELQPQSETEISDNLENGPESPEQLAEKMLILEAAQETFKEEVTGLTKKMNRYGMINLAGQTAILSGIIYATLKSNGIEIGDVTVSSFLVNGTLASLSAIGNVSSLTIRHLIIKKINYLTEKFGFLVKDNIPRQE